MSYFKYKFKNLKNCSKQIKIKIFLQKHILKDIINYLNYIIINKIMKHVNYREISIHIQT